MKDFAKEVPAALGLAHSGRRGAGLAVLLAVGAGMGLAGCKAKPPVSDEALTTTIQSQLSGDSALAGQPVTVTVQGGVATLDGVVSNDAQRTIAARDAAGVPGVKEVRNDLVVGTASAAVVAPAPAPALTPAPAPEPLKPSAAVPAVAPKQGHEKHEAAPIERVAPPVAAPSAQPAAPPAEQAAVAPPPPPPQPVYKNVTIPAGDILPVRVTQTLDSATTQQGTLFSGVVASDIVIDGLVAVPAGTTVMGQVDVVHEAAHFKGSALLTVSLSSLTRRGEKISLTTDPYTVEGKGRGKNTAEKTGGGAAVGAILGGIFGGGKGAAIGAAAGGGVGAGANAVTRGQQVQIPSETVVRFKLSGPVTVRARADGGKHEDNGDPTLQHHPGF